MKIRDMTINDIPAVKPLMDNLGYYLEYDVMEERFKSIMKSPEHHIFVSEIAGEVAGFLHIYGKLAFRKRKEIVIQAIAINELHLRKGVGSSLLKAGEDWAIANNFDTSTCWARPAGVAFYTNSGYEIITTSNFVLKKLI